MSLSLPLIGRPDELSIDPTHDGVSTLRPLRTFPSLAAEAEAEVESIDPISVWTSTPSTVANEHLG